jgi:hypothetical protein
MFGVQTRYPADGKHRELYTHLIEEQIKGEMPKPPPYFDPLTFYRRLKQYTCKILSIRAGPSTEMHCIPPRAIFRTSTAKQLQTTTAVQIAENHE